MRHYSILAASHRGNGQCPEPDSKFRPMVAGCSVDGRQCSEQRHLDDDDGQQVLRIANTASGVDHIAQRQVENNEVTGRRQNSERQIVA